MLARVNSVFVMFLTFEFSRKASNKMKQSAVCVVIVRDFCANEIKVGNSRVPSRVQYVNASQAGHSRAGSSGRTLSSLRRTCLLFRNKRLRIYRNYDKQVLHVPYHKAQIEKRKKVKCVTLNWS